MKFNQLPFILNPPKKLVTPG
uniref:Uncharacterized protein n=1 Tax=Rhizophora mucronata TaxID=61149 RepID=A0A2P2PWE8_RHIMU